MKYCLNCGAQIDDAAAYCPACGAPQPMPGAGGGQPNNQPYNNQPYNGQPYNNQPNNGQPFNGQPYNPNGPYNGYPPQQPQGQLNAFTVLAFIMSIMFPFIGLILCIAAHSNAKSAGDFTNARFAKAGIIISSCIIGLGVLAVLAVVIVSCTVFAGVIPWLY